METHTVNDDAPVETSIIPEPIPGSTRKRFNWTWILAPGLLFGGILIGYLGRPLVTPLPSAASNDTAQILQLLISKTRHWQGNANAPVTMLEFSDFQ